MLMRRRRLKIGFQLVTIVLFGTLAIGSVFAEEAASRAHGDGKASAPSAEPSDSRSHTREDGGGGAAKADDRHTPRGDDNRSPQGEPARGETNEPGKGVNTGTPGGENRNDIDTRISVQPRRLGAKPDKGGAKTTIESPAARDHHRRMLSVPRAPVPPVRNAVGVPVPQHGNMERRDIAHPNSLAAPHNSPAGATVVPGSTGSHVTKVEAGVDRHVPNANPVVTPPAANRGAITGTGLTHHNVGPSQIGGPKASVAGINGTTIKPKH